MERLVAEEPGAMTVMVRIWRTSDTYTELQYGSPREYLAASVAKLGIALYVERQIAEQQCAWTDQLVVQASQVRPGSGVLGVFPPGTTVSLHQAYRLMLSESDNTATNMVLEHVGSQRKVNSWLQREFPWLRTGLADRDDGLYESTTMSSLDAVMLMDRLRVSGQVAREAMRQSHFGGGLQLASRRWFWWQRYRTPALRLAVKLAAAVKSRWALDKLMHLALSRRSNREVASKVGLLNMERSGGLDRYRHEVGIVELPNGWVVTVAIFTVNARPDVLRRVGRLLGWWRWQYEGVSNDER